MATSEVEVVVVVDATTTRSDMRTDRGLSVLIHVNRGDGVTRRILLDSCTSKEVFLNNMNALGVDLSTVEAALVSHGHDDHTGGLGVICQAGVPVWIHSGAFINRYAVDSENAITRTLTIPEECRQAAKTFPHTHLVSTFTQVMPGIYVSGTVPRIPGVKEHLSPTHRKMEVITGKEMAVPDHVDDDMFVIVERTPGSAKPSQCILITGCGHSGLINDVEYARQNGFNVVGVIGGLHLGYASDEQISEVVSYCIKNLTFVYPLHCTSERAEVALTNAGLVPCKTGCGSRIPIKWA
ncbi:MBL fold metallo-hydrolase [Pelomyxa schiedti]|nr:MBL fold metallo-hydrolase [Pelomyxa schiedti]